MAEANFLHGSCLCGGITFRAVLPALGANHCFCTMCQRFHGAASGSYITVSISGYVVERGTELIAEYASSERVRRGFCRSCGSSLYWRGLDKESIDLALGALQPSWLGTVEREVHADTKPVWLPSR